MANIDIELETNIHDTMFKKYGLSLAEANKYGYDYLSTSPNIVGIFHDNTDGNWSRSFANVNNSYSYLLYWKAGHSMVNEIINKYNDINIHKSSEPIEENVVLPYKDPLDRFLSAFFTSRDFKGDNTGFNPKGDGSLYDRTSSANKDNINELISICYKKLDEFVNYACCRDDACGFGRDRNHPQFKEDMTHWPKKQILYDVHFTPIHIVLWYALFKHKKPFRIFGCNLDHDANSFIFGDIRRHEKISKEDKEILNGRYSANNRLIKLVCQQYKSQNGDKCQQIIQKYLSNDYKLISQLEKNTIIGWKDNNPI